MSRLRFATFVNVALLFLTSHALNAQQPKTNETRSESSARPEYVLEVHTPEGCMFSPITTRSKTGGLVYALSRPTKYLPDSYGRPIVSKVTFSVKQKGDAWAIATSVGLGEFYDAAEEQVSSVTLSTNERVEVAEVSRFGLRPFRVGVLRVLDHKDEAPAIRNLSQSLSVEAVENKDFPDHFRLSLKNSANKDVSALQYNTFNGYQLLFVRWVGSDPGKSLIKAGGTYQLNTLSEDKTCGEADGYHPNQANRIDIVSVVFTDGSYEGESALPALIRGSAYGDRQQLQRVLSGLEANDAATNPASLCAYLKNLYDTLDETPEPGVLEILLAGLPPQNSDAQFTINNFVRSGLHQVRVSLLRDSQNLELVARTKSAEETKAFCQRIIERYRDWLAGARALTSQ